MIVLAGIPSEPPLARVGAALEQQGAEFVWFDQRRAATSACEYALDADGLRGTLTLDGRAIDLDEVTGVYTRLMDDRLLPELAGLPADDPARQHCRALHETFNDWAELSPARVVNRVRAMASNGSKPFQAQLIAAAGFLVPETLVTNEPELVREFLAGHGRVIYKSTSGNRSIVQELDADSLARLDDIRWCPVQFQAYVPGVDVRVHVVGERVHATRISSGAADYRYAGPLIGAPARLEATHLSDAVEQRCVALTAALGLSFSGIDLRITPADEVYCFEVNPCPGYTYFEGHTGQPISAEVAAYLAATEIAGECREIRPE